MKKSILSIGILFLIGINQLIAQTNLFRLMQDEKANFFEIQALAKKYFDSVGTEKGSGYKIYQRWEYEMSLQIDRKGFRKTQAEISKEYQRADAHYRKSNARKNAVTNWTELGPDRKNPTSSWSPGVGRVTAIAVSLKNSNLIFVGAAASGVWRSSNGGSSWTSLMHTEIDQNIRALAVHPENDNIVFAGVAEGYFKSTDGGNTWVASNSIQGVVTKIIFHPTNSNIILAASSSGAYKSTNGGSSWNQVINTTVEDIEFKPGDPNVVYSVGYGGYFKSTNNGDSFSSMNSITGEGRSFVAVSPADPSVVYVVQADGNVFGKFYKSTNSGESFTIVSSGSAGNNNIFGVTLDGLSMNGQANYDLDFDVSPTDANLIQLGAINSYKSINGGITWIPTSNWTISGNDIGYNHADVHVMKYFGNILYSGSDGGIYRSTNNGDDWSDLSAGLGIRQFYRFGLCRANPEIISGGAQDNGSSVRKQDGVWYDWLGADGMENFIDHNNPDILYGAIQNGTIFKSTDGGNSMDQILSPAKFKGKWVTPFTMDPTTNTTLYLGVESLFKSTNSGDSWTTISNYTASGACDVIEIAPSNSNHIITRHGFDIYKTTDGGLNWSNITSPTQDFVITIAIHPTKPSHVVMGTSVGEVYYSTDFGNTFIQVTGASLPQITIPKIVFDGGENDGFYIGNMRGVFYRNNTMTDFLPFTENFPTQPVFDLEYHVATKRIYAATHGRGIWWAPAYNSGPINVKPTVVITEPGDNTSLIDPTSITVSANAEDTDGIKSVQFYANNILIGTDTDAPYSINWTSDLKTGSYSITAVATDNIGGKTTSSVIKLTINSSINKSPTALIVFPTEGQIIDESTQIVFSALGSDEDGSVVKIEFLVDGVLVSTVDNSDIHTYISKIKPGSHTFLVQITDNQGAIAKASVNFVVKPVIVDENNKAPKVYIMTPTKNLIVELSDAMPFSVNGIDEDGQVVNLKFFLDGILISENSKSPHTYYRYGILPAGSHKFLVEVTDNQGATTKDSVIFVVRKFLVDDNNNKIPQVEIVKPIDNQRFISPANVSITTNATDSDGKISKVEFYSGTTKLAQISEFPFEFNWSNVQVGDYNLTAVAFDNQGAKDTSDVVNIKVETSTKVDDVLQENEMFIYPNPACDVLYIRSPEKINKEYLVQITDVKGNLVFNQNLNLLNTFALNLKPFSNGLYFIKIQDGIIGRITKFEVKR